MTCLDPKGLMEDLEAKRSESVMLFGVEVIMADDPCF